MQLIMTQPDSPAPVNPDTAARQRSDRLRMATVSQMHAALAFLSMIDPEAFEIAFTAVTPASSSGQPGDAKPGDDRPADDEPVPVCRACGSMLGIFPERGLDWQHYRGDGITSGAQEIFDPGHAPEVIWCLPDEDPAEL